MVELVPAFKLVKRILGVFSPQLVHDHQSKYNIKKRQQQQQQQQLQKQQLLIPK